MALRQKDWEKLERFGIRTVDGPCRSVGVDEDTIFVETAEGTHRFDSVYPALGSDTHSDLAEMVGAKLSDSGCILVDAHQRTNVPGLYAAGDVVQGLDQISHARSEERRGGKECVIPGRSRWSPSTLKKNKTSMIQ